MDSGVSPRSGTSSESLSFRILLFHSEVGKADFERVIISSLVSVSSLAVGNAKEHAPHLPTHGIYWLGEVVREEGGPVDPWKLGVLNIKHWSSPSADDFDSDHRDDP